MEESVGVVELAGLECEELRGEGLQPQQVVEDEGRGGVVGAVVERGDLQWVAHVGLNGVLKIRCSK